VLKKDNKIREDSRREREGWTIQEVRQRWCSKEVAKKWLSPAATYGVVGIVDVHVADPAVDNSGEKDAIEAVFHMMS
jgi:hypothetical protein